MIHTRKLGFWLAGRLITVEFEDLNVRRYRQDTLKKRIQHRLTTEDYTCKLPKGDIVYSKPRIRYKLRTRRFFNRVIWK